MRGSFSSRTIDIFVSLVTKYRHDHFTLLIRIISHNNLNSIKLFIELYRICSASRSTILLHSSIDLVLRFVFSLTGGSLSLNKILFQ